MKKEKVIGIWELKILNSKVGILLITMILFTLVSCKRQYSVEGDKVYYESWNEARGSTKDLLDSADSKTFSTIENDYGCNFIFGKDKNHLYIDGDLIKGIDPNSFSFVGNYIFKDKDSAYFFGFYNSINDCVISTVKPDEIKLIKFPWAKTNNKLIWGKETVLLDDINDFVPIDRDWGKTNSKIIWDAVILIGADIKTFKVINSFTGRDKNHTYKFGEIK